MTRLDPTPAADVEPPVKRRHVLVAAVVVLVACMILLSQGLVPAPGRAMTLLAVIVMEGAFVLCTLAACAGYGYRIRRALFDDQRQWAAVQMAMGVGAVMLMAWLLGWAGWLNGWTAWVIVVVGWGLWVPQLKRRFELPRTAPWPAIVAMPAVALVVVAAALAPGALWQPTEFNGYDALSYHLQLPGEWMAGGAIQGYEHNVYSFLPNGFESVYLFLGHLRGGTMIEAAIACQFMHAGMALLTAAVIAQMVSRQIDKRDLAGERSERVAVLAGPAAGALYLATPWVAVTGSLAYNEQAMMALGAAGLAVAIDPGALSPVKRGAATGLLCGLAMLVKLTALGMFALPVGVALLLTGQHRRAVGAFVIAAAVPLGLFMARNVVWTGNPVFPMLADVLGSAHWTAEQVARWNAAHSPGLDSLGLGARLGRVWSAWLGHDQFGYVVMPVAAVALVGGIMTPRTRRLSLTLVAIAAIQLAFWLGATHVQSRFALPLLVPAGVAFGVALGIVTWRRPVVIAVVVAALVPTGLGYHLYMQQHDGAAPELMDGTLVMQQVIEPHATLNTQLPPGSRLYAEGFATPFYVQPPLDYHTVWDASPLGRWIDQRGMRGALRHMQQAGYTHLLVNRAMLGLWRSPDNYGYDPSFDAERQTQLESLGLPVAAEGQSLMPGQPAPWVLYRLSR